MAYKLIALDIGKDDSFVRAYTTRQGEAGDKIQAEIFRYGLPVASTDVQSAIFKVVTPLTHYVETAANWVTTADGYKVLEATTTSNMNSETGYMKRAYFELTMNDGTILTTPDLIYFVLPAADISSGNAKDYISRVEEVIKQVLADYDKYIQDLKNAFNATADALEEDYNAAKKKLQDSVDAFLKTVNDKLVAITSKLSSLDTIVTDLTQQVADLKAKMDEIVANGAMTKKQADAAYMNIVATPIVAQDWNTLTTIGTYSVENATGANMPGNSAKWGTLLVQGRTHGKLITQLYICNNEMFFRRRGGETEWSTWNKLGDDVDTTTVYTLKDTVTSALNNVYQIGFYHLQGNALPSDIPDLSAETGEKDGYLLVYTRKGNTYVRDTIQVLNFPDLGKVFMRLQKNKVPIGNVGTTALTWYDWHQIAGAPKAATGAEVNAGTDNSKTVTPKALADSNYTKQADVEKIVNTSHRDEYIFGAGTNITPIKTSGTIIPIGAIVSKDILSGDSDSLTLQSNGTIKFNKDMTVVITGGATLVVGDTSPTDYLYLDLGITNQTSVNFIAQGAVTTGTLRLTWSAMGMRTATVKAGDIMKITASMRTSRQAFSAQLTALSIREVKGL